MVCAAGDAGPVSLSCARAAARGGAACLRPALAAGLRVRHVFPGCLL